MVSPHADIYETGGLVGESVIKVFYIIWEQVILYEGGSTVVHHTYGIELMG